MVDISQNAWGYIIAVAGIFVFSGPLCPVNAYGRLFTAIQADLNTTAAQTGWIGAMAWSGAYLGSPLAVVLVTYSGYRATTVIGAVVASASYLATAFMDTYVGILMFFGVILGLASGLVVHTTFSCIFKTLAPPKHNRGSSLTSAGCSFGTLLLTVAFEKMVPTLGWRRTLQIVSIYCAALAIPGALFISPHEKTPLPKRKTSDAPMAPRVGKHSDRERKSSVYSVSERVETATPADEAWIRHLVDLPKHKSWLRLFPLWRTWLLGFAILFPAMSWSVYWVNIVSYYESISVPEDDIFLYVTIQSFSDLVGKLFLAAFATRLPDTAALVVISNFVLAIVTMLLTVVPTKPFFICSSVFIGVGRGWYNVLPLKASVDLLQVVNSDQAVTVAMTALGVAFMVGTLPAGFIYDTTGSYNYAFVLNGVFYIVGGALLILLMVLKKVKRERKVRRLSQRPLTGGDNKGIQLEPE